MATYNKPKLVNKKKFARTYNKKAEKPEVEIEKPKVRKKKRDND